jgi:hypothetical protein
MKTHAGAVGGGGQPVAQDDSSDASSRAALKKPTLGLMGGSSPVPVSSTDPSPDIRLAMLGVSLPVLDVLLAIIRRSTDGSGNRPVRLN